MLNSLTLRESEVLPLLAMGYSNKQIGDKLCISVSTVKVHVQEILSNLRVRNRIQAAAVAAYFLQIKPEEIIKVANRQRG